MNASQNSVEDIDIVKILSVLPHRYPFLLIDKIINVNADQSATGVKNVTFNEPHFQGHFPGQPIMPGVLIIEAMAQTAGALSLLSNQVTHTGVVYFLTIDNAKFRRPVVPGDQLLIHVEKLRQRGNMIRFACVAEVAGNRVAEAEISAMITIDDVKE